MSLNTCAVCSGPVLLVFMNEADDNSHFNWLGFCKEPVDVNDVNVNYVSYYVTLF